MPPIELRTPTSFLFFAASVYIAREAGTVTELRWFALAAFSFFTVLGPLAWLDSGLSNGSGNGMVPIGDLVEKPKVLRVLIWYGQAISIVIGMGLVWYGIVAVAF